MMRQQIVGILACLVLGVGAACGGPKQAKTAPVVQPEAELARGMQLFRRGQFRKAQVVFQRLTFEFSVTQEELAQARYYVAECSFQLGDYVQAASDFRKVADEFSTTAYAPTALLRAGDSNLKLWHRPELDPSYGETALAIYQELAGRYPDSDAAGRARLHVRRLETQFAEKAYKTGIFYMRRKAFDSAIIYFKDVIATYPNAARAPDALLRLVDSYRAIGYTQEVQETCEHLRRFYPNASRLEASCPAPPATPT
jgi:outer membrane protein assembly factor BamD